MAIVARDFRAIVAHAGTLDVVISAFYSQPTRPMQITYNDNGLFCEFVLLTHGDFRGDAASAAHQSRPMIATKKRAIPPTVEKIPSGNADTSMPPPSRSAETSFSQASSRTKSKPPSPPPPPPQPSIDRESLFIRDESDDDRQWDPEPFQGEDEDLLGWDARAENVCS